jgi:beta-lactamase regulating signal transducer with metallopeptidase domain
MQILAIMGFSEIAPFAPAAASAWIATAWQGVAIAAVLTLCLRLFPRASAAQRFSVWAAGFFAIASLPFLPSSGSSPATTSLSSSFSGAMSAHSLQLDIRWSLLIAAVWLAASMVRAVVLAAQFVRLRLLWKDARPADHPGVAACPKLFGRRPIQLCTTKRLDRPSVIGFFSPRILIPDWLLPRLAPRDLEQIVLHETQHLRRGDDWTNLLQKLVLIVFPLSPALLWIDRRLSLTREMACDEGVVKITQAPRAYASFLAGLAQHGLDHRFSPVAQGALALGAWQRRSELAQRVQSILRARPTLSIHASRGLLASVTCGLSIAAFELAQCPQLVAFVPAPSAQMAVSHASASGLSGYYAMTAKAVLPPTPGPNAILTRPPIAHAARKPVAHPASPAPMLQTVAETSETQPAAGYIVFTSWEQVITPASAQRDRQDPQGDLANRDQADGLSSAGQSSSGQSHATSQITVTRLIFRVVPADPNSTQPSAAPVRHGWFVIQL